LSILEEHLGKPGNFENLARDAGGPGGNSWEPLRIPATVLGALEKACAI